MKRAGTRNMCFFYWPYIVCNARGRQQILSNSSTANWIITGSLKFSLLVHWQIYKENASYKTYVFPLYPHITSITLLARRPPNSCNQNICFVPYYFIWDRGWLGFDKLNFLSPFCYFCLIGKAACCCKLTLIQLMAGSSWTLISVWILEKNPTDQHSLMKCVIRGETAPLTYGFKIP